MSDENTRLQRYEARTSMYTLVRHPVDVLITVAPMFRPLRVLRVFTVAQTLFSRHGQFSIA